MSAESNYHSPLREQAKHETRIRILEAVVRVVLDDGIHAFSVANVAKRAGVSQRTVYRHFTSREELLEGLSAWIDGMGDEIGLSVERPVDLRDVPAHLGVMFEGLERVRDAAEVEFITAVALRYALRGKQERWAWIQRLVAERFPGLTPEEQLDGAVALRALLGAHAWFHLCVQLGLEAPVASRGLTRAASLVIEDLERRHARAAQRRDKKRQ